MTTTSRKLTYHGTLAAATLDTITLSGPDKTQPGAADPAWKSPSSTGAGQVAGGRIYNAGTADIFWSYAATAAAAPDPSTSSNEGVRRLPAGATDRWNEVFDQVVVKAYCAVAADYSIEVNP